MIRDGTHLNQINALTLTLTFVQNDKQQGSFEQNEKRQTHFDMGKLLQQEQQSSREAHEHVCMHTKGQILTKQNGR